MEKKKITLRCLITMKTSYEEGADYSTINENLFYRNERKVDVADPCVVYVDDENDTDYGSDVYVRHNGQHGTEFCSDSITVDDETLKKLSFEVSVKRFRINKTF